MNTEFEVRILGIAKKSITTKDVNRIYLDYGYDLEKINELILEED